MCDVDSSSSNNGGGGDTGATTMEGAAPLPNDAVCAKCKTRVATLVVRDPFCGECFFPFFSHKFRARLGKAKAIRPSDSILLAFSGGPSSAYTLPLPLSLLLLLSLLLSLLSLTLSL